MAPGVIGTPNGATPNPRSATTSDIGILRSRYEHAKYGDSMKNALIEDLIARYEDLVREHESCGESNADNTEFARMKDGFQALQNHVLHLQRIMNRDPFLLVLIDGDGMIFSNHLLQLGEAGGKQAAKILNDGVTKWARTNVIECPVDLKVFVRIYADVAGLAKRCTTAGHTSSTTIVERFTNGFTSGGTLIDFIDVGADATFGKISDNFEAYVYNYHCRQVLLGCSHDNEYAPVLKRYTDDEALSRVTLLEGALFEKDLAVLPFPKVKLPGLFRETKIDPVWIADSRVDSRIDLRSSSALNGASGVFTPGRVATPATYHSPGTSISSLTGRSSHVRSDSIASSGIASSDNGGSWATVIGKNKHLPLKDLVRPAIASPASEVILRNRAGQRIDIPMDFDRDEVNRMKKMKCCNQFYIGDGCCHYTAGRVDKCPHNHDYKLSVDDLKTLRVVAKETPCKKGHTCDVPGCIYGHVCPFPKATQGSNRGMGCLVGPECRFPRTMHDMDVVAVKTIRATGAF